MPIYEYLCECGQNFQIKQNFDDPKLKACKDIGSEFSFCDKDGKVQRLISKPTLLKMGHLSDKKLREDLGDNIDS
jgi:putative FmdB family regulatory protein|tara:strand:+ start:111 stop:335 length:225 start_codon:yes stop_codon:yes gene_type:complete